MCRAHHVLVSNHSAAALQAPFAKRPQGAIFATRPRSAMSGGRTRVGDEQELIERAKAGDQAAFRRLFVAHREQVLRLIHRLLGPSNDVEDVLQEVFIHVYRSLGSFRGEARFSTWLYRLTTNVVRMHLRKGKSRPKLVPAGDREEVMLEKPNTETPAAVAERTERIKALYRLLDGLSEKKREALVLHDLQGMSAAEVAKVADVPVLTVRTRLFYARKELYAALANEPALQNAAKSLTSAARGKRGKKRTAAVEAEEAGS